MANDSGSERLSLILLPGLLCDAALWEHQRQYLADIADVHVADLTGGGSIGEFAGNVLSMSPRRFALAGLSMGGYVAMEIMRRAPERVLRLCLLDTTARPDTPEQTERRKALIRVAEGGGFARIMPTMLPNLVHPDHLRDHRISGEAVRMADRVGSEAFVRQQRAIMARPDSRPFLPSISVPTLCIAGREDTLTPPDRAEEMAAAIPGAEVAVVERCGHLSTLEQPEEVTRLMRNWLLRPR
ncbi:alpha/beta fold hydrolase [Indioceanicola profundi]|uniref:alpha/beta fold hydrolase n=1 Tax=Indioceanicola profundi TaxID=2220096 RepID=UPI000E6AE095|nr:alpha/beta fold hydrolase [Indioceanicola profundi]